MRTCGSLCCRKVWEPIGWRRKKATHGLDKLILRGFVHFSEMHNVMATADVLVAVFGGIRGGVFRAFKSVGLPVFPAANPGRDAIGEFG